MAGGLDLAESVGFQRSVPAAVITLVGVLTAREALVRELSEARPIL